MKLTCIELGRVEYLERSHYWITKKDLRNKNFVEVKFEELMKEGCLQVVKNFLDKERGKNDGEKQI